MSSVPVDISEKARLAPRLRHVEHRQLAALVVLYDLLHPNS
jgi:hypothetical protein